MLNGRLPTISKEPGWPHFFLESPNVWRHSVVLNNQIHKFHNFLHPLTN